MIDFGTVTLSDGRNAVLQDVFTSIVTGKQLAIVRVGNEKIVVNMEAVN